MEYNFEWFDKLGVMGYPLLLCSVICMAIIFERLVFFIRITDYKKTVFEDLNSFLNDISKYKKSIRDEMMSLKIQEVRTQFYSGLNILKIISTIAPMFGLLGTVLGILKAFMNISQHTGPVSANMVASGLFEAMLTTALGLSIALPCIVMYFIYSSISNSIISKFTLQLNHISLGHEVKS